MKFLQQDLEQFKKHNLTEEKVMQDLKHFKNGFPNLEIVNPATIGNGIFQLNNTKKEKFSNVFEKSNFKILKFVPASGAASRMFKLLHCFLDEFPKSKQNLKSFLQSSEFKPLKDFFNDINKLPFYDEIYDKLHSSVDNFDDLPKDEKILRLVDEMLSTKAFGLSDLPKGLIVFHNYGKEKVTAFEEHFHEASKYAANNGLANLHFTISEDHLEKFKSALENIQSKVERETNTKFKVSFSFQNPATDTIAVDFDNQPFRKSDGKLLLRPAGHGALIENLNNIDADLVFIKNIDNVSLRTNDKTDSESNYYKKILAGILINLQNKTFKFIRNLQDNPNEDLKEKAVDFLKNKLNVYSDFENVDQIISVLNRPIRVCGMVINQGAPGGGPFWIKNNDGTISLQIVEKSQIDLTRESQQKHLSNSTHFNPVDIVCGIKNYKGETFNLKEFVDPDKGFIAEKYIEGTAVKALELPGLWNGGMAFWNTVFVEVPAETFNPVKTVLDLLKPEHQAKVDV
ncbi:DUF4301 family protein [Psychroflexus aestuariivivens]|uniref:DUF4301 family protein n=1 Tax=Psychroflexus aestuariivivens TaxID=1795040 RepID=UPI000FDC3B38|nr:DUF4301 family protein [Psychroflexus aestuariivivens]